MNSSDEDSVSEESMEMIDPLDKVSNPFAKPLINSESERNEYSEGRPFAKAKDVQEKTVNERIFPQYLASPSKRTSKICLLI